ncbi:MAG: isochorismatase family protein [Candidatus Thiodiazotropha sp. (ex Monitilora ramsayi)]|nr:isochorismatase family protein [Candidatus Thiodiazotropha sp. (ex Monitilora ramsayi)]
MTLCNASDSRLIIVDIQERLTSVMKPEIVEAMTKGCTLLLDAAVILNVPILCTQQYPKGLGPMQPTIDEHLPGNIRKIDKTCFSVSSVTEFQKAVESGSHKQLILAGIETHVCILQSAFGLKALGYEVFVVEDAVCSRNPAHHRNAMDRMRRHGIIITNTESVIFEWLRDSRHEQFGKISALLKQAS